MFGIKLTFFLTVLINFYQCAVINVTQLSTGLTLSFDQTKGLLVLVPTPSSTSIQSQGQNGVNGGGNSFMSLFRGAQNYYGQNPMLWNLQNIAKINPKNSSSSTGKEATGNTTSNKTTEAQIGSNVSEIEDKNKDTHLLDFNRTEQKKTVPQQNNQLTQNNHTEQNKNQQIAPSNVSQSQILSTGSTSQPHHHDQGLPQVNVSTDANGTSIGSEQTGNVSIIEEEQNKTLGSQNSGDNGSITLQENNDEGQEINAKVTNSSILPELAEQTIQEQPKPVTETEEAMDKVSDKID